MEDIPLYLGKKNAVVLLCDTVQWYHLNVDYVLRQGMMNGVGDDIFAPSGALSAQCSSPSFGDWKASLLLTIV